MNILQGTAGAYAEQRSTLPFSPAVPDETVSAPAVLPEGGVWDVIAEVWPNGTEPPGPSFVYPAAARNVTWRLVNRVTGQQVWLSPNYREGSATSASR